MFQKLATINKALVGAVLAAGTAALPAVQDALNEWASGVIGVIVTGLGVFAVRNRPST